jgi:hypothetical protein
LSFAKEIRVTPAELDAKLREEPDPRFYAEVTDLLQQVLAVVEAEPDWRRSARSALRLVDPRPAPMVAAVAEFTLDQGAAQVARRKNAPREAGPLAVASIRAAMDMLASASAG